MEPKKIALCIRGHLRTYLKTFDNLKEKILNDPKYEITIFLHTWNTMNHDNNLEIPSLEVLQDLYKTKNIVIENQNNVRQLAIFFKNKNRDKFKFQLYGIHKLKNIVREYEKINNMKFDYYISTRFDIYYNINLDEMIQIMDNKDILTDTNFVYYDLANILNNNSFDLYSDMILLPFRYYKNKYRMYGIIPMIDCLIKQGKMKQACNRFAWIMR